MRPAAEARQTAFPRATLADVPAVLALAEAAAARAGLGAGEAFELKLALEEAFTNVVRHGYGAEPGPVEIQVSAEGGELTVQLEDRAPHFDPTSMPPPALDAPLEYRMPGGLGIHLIRQSVDEWRHEALPDGNRLTLVKRLPGSHP
jgi:serine/threonine-protein kinase RsbW